MGTLTSVDATRLSEAAGRAADLLVDTAIEADDTSTWLGVAPESGRDGARVVYRTGDAALYDGSAGIAMAAWSVAAALARDDLAKAAVGAARHAVSAQDRFGGIGLFDGLAGIGLAALEVGDGANDAQLRTQGLDILGRVAATATSDVDLISGSAGVIIALLGAGRRTGADRWTAAAVRHGEHLIATATRNSWGWSWSNAAFEGPDLCGLAHGAAGIAWALGSLAAVTGDARFLEAVDGARRYERSWFQRVENSWPDLRHCPSPEAPLVCPALWCHGSTGIGLSRLALFRLTRQPSLAAESASALQSATSAASQALRGYPEAGLTLCHGLGGTLLLLLAAHRALGETEHLDAARSLAYLALDRLGDDPSTWPGGVPNGGFSPGLMTGFAGMMFVLARVADPDRTCALAVLGDQGE